MSGISSGEVSGDCASGSNGDVNTSEVSEVESPSAEITESNVDEDFSAELDDSYLSYMEDGKINKFEKQETGEVKENDKTTEEIDSPFEHEVDSKYSDYFNGKHASNEIDETDDVSELPEDMDDIEYELDKKYNEYIDEGSKDTENIEDKHGELSDTDRAELKQETGWSDEVVDSIDTSEQAEIYKNADLHEDNINGRECLVKEIDYDYVDEKTGMTNRELMAKGRSPYDAKSGEKIELHHMGQEYDAPFAELTENSEHGDGNHSILHPKTEGSWRNDETLEVQYNKEKREHWKTRSEG